MSKLKALVISHSAELGGAELALQSLIISTKEKYEWSLVLPAEGPAVKLFEKHVSNIYILPYSWWCGDEPDSQMKNTYKSSQATIAALMELCTSYDLTVTNTITVPWLAEASSRVGKPHIWYIHEFGNIDHNLHFRLGYRQSLHYIQENSSVIMTISNSVRSHLIANGIQDTKIEIIHQSGDFSKLLSLPAGKNIQKPLKCLMLGAIKPGKGQLVAVKAIESLPDIHLSIIGPIANQAYYDKIDDYIHHNDLKNKTTLRGGFSSILKPLRDADVLIICSSNEALGRVTLEGLAAGKIVIGNNSGATPELLDAQRGILYDSTAKNLKLVLKNLSSHVSELVSTDERRSYVKANYGSTSEFSDFDRVATRALHTLAIRHTGTLLQKLLTANAFPSVRSYTSSRILDRIKHMVPTPLKNSIKAYANFKRRQSS